MSGGNRNHGNGSGNRTAGQLAEWRRDPAKFIGQVLINPETKAPFGLYEAQRRFLREGFRLTEDGRLVHNELVFSGPKKLGKSTFSALIVIYVAVCLAGENGEIYFAANDAEQSQSRGFKLTAQILRASPLLRGSVDIGVARITFRASGTTVVALANDYAGFSGSNPVANIFDELAYFNSESSRRMFDEGIPSPARRISFRLSTSTAGFDGEPSPLRDLYDRAMTKGEEIAPDLRRHENMLCYWRHEPVPEMHPQWWLDQQAQTLRPVQFKRLIQNQWVSTESTFIDLEQWDRCVDPALRPVLSDTNMEVFGGFDCSVKGDYTAFALVEFNDDLKAVQVVHHKVFKPGQGADINFAAVEQHIIEISDRFDLKQVFYDPFQAESMAQRLRAVGVNMTAFPQTQGNLEAAASNLLTLVESRNIRSYQSDELRTAIGNCRSVETLRGFRLSKIVSSRKIDLTAALSFAALAAVREGTHGEPNLLKYYRLMAERHRSEDRAAQSNQPPTPAQIAQSEVSSREFEDESGEDLIRVYEDTLREFGGGEPETVDASSWFVNTPPPSSFIIRR